MTREVVGQSVITAEVDASGVEAGVGAAKKSLAGYEAAAKAAGKAGAEGMRPATTATVEYTAEQRKLITQIERTTVLNTQGRAALLEMRAAQAGVTEAVADHIAKLKAAEASNKGLADSAQRVAYQMRQVAPQITDVVTQLSAGQAPLQVLIQQGGQLKDVFGGVGPALRTVGAYLLGLINPMTVAAAVAGALGFAFFQGRKEAEEFTKAVVLNNQAIGVSVSQFTSLRDALTGVGVTRGKAAEVLTQIASNASLAGSNVRLVGEAAILMEKATGQAVSKTLEHFADLRKSPTDAAAKLNETVNFLTAAQYRQIRALEETGQKQQAADIAEKSYAEALKLRAQSVIESQGLMERGWNKLAGAAKGAWDSMLGVGREESIGERLQRLSGQVALAQAPTSAGNTETKQRTQYLQDQLRASFRRYEIEQLNSQTVAENNRLQQLGVTFLKDGEAFLTKQQQRERELTKAQTEGQQLVNAGIITETQLRQRLQGIRDKYNDTTGRDAIAQQQANRTVAAEENKRLQRNIDTLDFTQPTKLTDAEKRLILLDQFLDKNGALYKQLTANEVLAKERERTEAAAAVQDEKKRAALEKQSALTEAAVKTTDQQVAATWQAAEATRQQAEEQEAANAVYGKAASAVAEYRAQLIRARASELEGTGTADPRQIASLNAQADAQERLAKALKQGETKQASEQTRQLSVTNKDEAELLQLELSLVGRIGVEREQIVARRRVELEYEKKIADVQRSNLKPEDKAAEVAKLEAEKVVAANNATTRTVLNDWQRTSDQINQSLTDALLRGFEAGKGFAKNFRDTLVNLFKTVILRPIIQGIMAPVSGAVAGITQSLVGGSLASFGGTAAASTIAGSFNPVLSAGAGAGLLSGVANGLSAWGSGGSVLGVLSNPGLYTGAELLGAALPVVGAGLAIAALVSGKGGGPKQDGRAGTGLDSLIGAADNSLGDKVKNVVDGITASYDAIAKALGGAAGQAKFGLALSTDPQGTSPSFVEAAATVNGQRVFQNLDRGVGRSDEALTAALDLASKQALLKALQASNLPSELGEYIKTVTASSSEAIAAAIDRVTKAVTERQTLEDRLFDLTATDAQKLARTRDRERAAIDSTNQALLEQVYRQEDLKAAADKAKESMADLSSSIASALSGYRTSGGLSRNQALAQIQTAIALSKAGGTLGDTAALKDAISVVTQLNESSFASRLDFLKARGSDVALLTQLQDAVSGVVTTPTVSAAQALANQQATTAATAAALKEANDKLQALTEQMAAMASDARRSRDVLEGVSQGDMTFNTVTP